jgi:tetratricopeptide (TPR) repeat protein
MDSPDTDRRITELWDGIPSAVGTARAGLLLELADHLMEAERHDEALPVLETAHDLLVEAGDDRLAGRAAHNRGVVLGCLSRPDERIAAEHEAIDHYERAQRRDLSGCSRMALGFHLAAAGRVKEALPVFLAAEADFKLADERLHLGNAMLAIMEALVDLGRFPAAERRLRPTLAVLAATAPVPAVARLHELAAIVFENRRGTDLAQKALRNARAVWDALDEETHVAACDIRNAVLTVGADPKAASMVLKQLRLDRQAAGDVDGVAACDRGLGLAAATRHRPHQALRRFEDAAAVFQACALFADAAECDALAAGALADLGRHDEAVNRFRQALPALAALHRPRAEAEARVRLAQLLLVAGDTKAALREAKRAESIARRGIINPLLDASRQVRHRAEQRLRDER